MISPFRPGRNKRQPLGLPRIDWSNPITKGLSIAVNGAEPYDAVRKIRPDVFTQTVGQMQVGSAFKVVSASSTDQRYSSSPIGGGDVTCFVLATPTAYPATNGALCAIENVPNNGGLEFVFNPSGEIHLWAGVAAAWTDLASARTYPLNSPFRALYTYVGTSGAASLCVNSNVLSSGSITANAAVSNTLTIGEMDDGAGTPYRFFDGGIHLILMWNRILSAAEISAVMDNPWQVFAPKQLFMMPKAQAYVPVFGSMGQFDKALQLAGWFDEEIKAAGWFDEAFLVAASGSLAAQASGAALASGSATLSGQIGLAAVGVATAGGSANAGVSVPLSATGVAVAGGSANRVATITISAAGLAQAAGQAGVSAAVLLAAAGAAAATGNGLLAGQIVLAAAGAALAAGNATLGAQLAAVAAGGDQAGGTAGLTGGPSGAISAAGGDMAAGSAVLVAQIAAIASGLDTAAGSGVLAAKLAAVASGAAVAGGAAGLVALFSAVAAGADQAAGTANLTGGALGAIAAAGGDQAAGSALLKVTVVVAATGGDQASGSATRSATVALTAAGFVQAIGAGLLTVAVPLSAAGQAHAGGSAAATAQMQAHAFWLAGGTGKVGRADAAVFCPVDLDAADRRLPTAFAGSGRATRLGCTAARNLTLHTEVLHV